MEPLWKTNAPSDLPVYPEVPYAFFGFHPGLTPGPSTYSTFGILRFTVLSRLGRRESYQGTKKASTNKKVGKPGKCLWVDTPPLDALVALVRFAHLAR